MRNATRWQGGDWTSRLYAQMPPRWLASADRVVRCGTALARGRMPVRWYEGTLADAGERGRVAVVDGQATVLHFVQRLFAEPREPTAGGAVTWLGTDEAMARLANEADLVLARLHAGLGRRRLGPGWLRVPEAVACHATLPAEGAVPARAKRGQGGNLRILRRSALRWDVSHDPADYTHFYQRMYVPFAEHRFGDLASVRSEQRLRSHFLRGGLIRVLDGERWVGGVVYSVDSAALRVWVVGIVDGDITLLERGVMTANWAFAFERAQQLGVPACHMGLSRPALNDGVLVYKKRWGASLNRDQPTHHALFVRWEQYNPTAARLLQASPLLFYEGNVLSGLTAMEQPPEPAAVERLAIELAVPGMQRLYVMAPQVQTRLQCEMTDERVRELEVHVVPQSSSAQLDALLSKAARP